MVTEGWSKVAEKRQYGCIILRLARYAWLKRPAASSCTLELDRQVHPALLCAGLVSIELEDAKCGSRSFWLLWRLALSGCNANQAINSSSQPASQVFAGHYVVDNPYDPTSYAQNNTGRGGGR